MWITSATGNSTAEVLILKNGRHYEKWKLYFLGEPLSYEVVRASILRGYCGA